MNQQAAWLSVRSIQGRQNCANHFRRCGAVLASWLPLMRSPKMAVVKFVRRPQFVKQPRPEGAVTIVLPVR